MQLNVSDLMGMFEQFQNKLEELKSKLASLVIEGEAGGGMAKAAMNGNFQLVRLDIDPSLLSPENKKMLEDLVIAAVNITQQKTAEAVQKMSEDQFGFLGPLRSMLPPLA